MGHKTYSRTSPKVWNNKQPYNAIEVVDLKTLQTKYRDINNYYYNEPFTWTKNDW